MSPSVHQPVMLDEVLHWLAPKPGQVFVDGTLGGGGHTEAIARQVMPNGRVIALDRDPEAIARAQRRVGELPIRLVQANFSDLDKVLASYHEHRVDGVLLDLGLSSDQLADLARGFSFQSNGPLDLRFDPGSGQPAWEWLAEAPEQQIADVIYRYGEERYSRRIARRIVQQRRDVPIRTAAQLADLVRKCVPRSKKHPIDPATRTFQALRIAVNDEIGALERALAVLPDCLREGGRLVVISFHSLEDRCVKWAFRNDSRWTILTKKPIRPNEAELSRNPRSRSAKLRAAERNREEGISG